MAAFGLGLIDNSNDAQAASSISTTQMDRSIMGGQPSLSPSRRASRHLTLCSAASTRRIILQKSCQDGACNMRAP